MREADDLPLESGERSFGYKSGNLYLQVGLCYVATFLVSGSIVAIVLSAGFSPPIWTVALGLLGTSIVVGLAGLTLSRTIRHEKIVLTAFEVAWVDRNGTERIRRHFAETSYVEEGVFVFGRRHFTCSVKVGDARIVFSDYIDDYARLKAFFIAQRKLNS